MGHRHEHGREGAPAPAGSTRRLGAALGITGLVLVAEVFGSVLTGSLALLVDAGHMLTDCAGLAIALLAAVLARRPPSARRTWSWARAEVLAAALQGLILVAVGAMALVEGIQRLLRPPQVSGGQLLFFGVLGMLANIASALVLSGGRRANLNTAAAFLEVMSDALGSLAVVLGAVVIALTGWARADTVAGLLIAALIVPRAILLAREAASILLESTPAGLDLDDVRRHFVATEHVLDVQDLHASLIATGLPTVTAHVVLRDECFHDGHALEVLDSLQTCLATHFAVSVTHSTIQLEPAAHGNHEPELRM
ncbi:cobalt-zinc-cadmium efflux system protein [Propionibacterium cyclohexanicum]|uniref:Cobalt-zinc-cadmium efflux system protein n=1 Tax=Propionibacterium cyclohexanicum TaxID=64702 RepID=A0A1H9SZ34_9ACTN|nr:cation diffusion facilitator family transporter [Propionibacterium cyclohexanicum]SER90215.1 cobalt-zinc-cadmium efflux system protein [Propionibacterium cyclohexanicum]